MADTSEAAPMSRAEATQMTMKKGYDLATNVDWVAVGAGLVVIIAAVLMYNQSTHTLPQTSTTFTVRPVLTLDTAGLLKTKAAFESSTYHTTSKLEAFGALKYTLGCYGRTLPVLSEIEATAWAALSALQIEYTDAAAVSVCTCIDEHVSVAFGSTLFLGNELDARVDALVAAANAAPIYQGFPLRSMRGEYAMLPRMTGNVPVRLVDDSQFAKLTTIRDWCVQSAAPVYTLHVASVWNSRLLLLLGVSLMLIGLDLFSTRRLTHGNKFVLKWSLVWLLDFVPFFFYLVRVFMEANETHLRGETSRLSFLMVIVFVAIGTTLAVLLIFSLWANWYKRGTGIYNAMWERIFVDFPMLIGLALVGVALKMQNDEHDELVLFSTLMLLVAGGLLQHVSNLVKVVYDIVCYRFTPELLQALNTGAEFVASVEDASDLDHTRKVLQHFGWTRLYGFFAVLLCGLLSFTISATSSISTNPLQFFTQNQYVYFVLAYIVALTGLDLFYEALPFVTEKDTQYGEDAADRMRKLFVCVYLCFLLFSQYAIEVSEA
jgi:hypothetical protein